MKNNQTTQTRRDFLKRLTGAFVVVPVLINAKEYQAENICANASGYTDSLRALDMEWIELVQKFDGISPKGQQKMLDKFIHLRRDVAKDFDYEMSEVANEIFDNMQQILERRRKGGAV
jgi:hypothetical protein